MIKYSTRFIVTLSALFNFATANAQTSEDVSPAQVEPPQPINLNGFSELEYVPAKESYEDWRALADSWKPEFLLLVNEQGNPTYCEPVSLSIAKDISERLCADLVKNARIEILKGYRLGGREGIVAVSKEPITQLLELRPANKKFPSPFSFTLVDLGSQEFLDYAPPSSSEADGILNDPTKLVTPSEIPRYPVRAQTEKTEGVTRMVIGVGVDGVVQSCRPIQTAGSTYLDEAACKYALETLRFEPMPSLKSSDEPFFHLQSITWQMTKKKDDDKK